MEESDGLQNDAMPISLGSLLNGKFDKHDFLIKVQIPLQTLGNIIKWKIYQRYINLLLPQYHTYILINNIEYQAISMKRKSVSHYIVL